MLKFENICQSFGEQKVLEQLNLLIPNGSTFCLIGESGSGKSLIMKLLLGLQQADNGEIWIDEKPISSFDENTWRKVLSKFGVLFQNAALFSSLTVAENVGLKLAEERIFSPNEIQRKISQALSQVGLGEEVLQKYPDELSGGMRKRVGIARAIIHEPAYIIYDEPTTGLDPLNAQLIDELIWELAQDPNRTSIVITHDFQTVQRLRGIVAMLQNHNIYFYGDYADFCKQDDPVIRRFLGRR